MREKIIPIIIGIILAGAASYMLKTYLDQQKVEFRKQAEETVVNMQRSQVGIFVASMNIAAGEDIGLNAVESTVVFDQQVPPDAIRNLSQLEGKVASRDIRKGDVILASMIGAGVRREREAGISLAMAVPEGMRAVSIAVDNIASLGGMIRPGNHVDIIGILPTSLKAGDKQVASIPIFQDVLILAIGDDMGLVVDDGGSRKGLFTGKKKEEKKSTGGVPLITLALKAEEVGILSYVQEYGKIKLILRSPGDTGRQVMYPIDSQAFMQYLMSQGGIAPAPKEEEKPEVEVKKKRTIEINRGAKKEVKEIAND